MNTLTMNTLMMNRLMMKPATKTTTDTHLPQKTPKRKHFELYNRPVAYTDLYMDIHAHQYIHPSSVLFKNKPELVVFTELLVTQKSYMKALSLVDATWLTNAQPAYFRQHRIIQGSE